MGPTRPSSRPPEPVEVVWPDTAGLDAEAALLADAEALVKAGHAVWVDPRMVEERGS